MVASALIATTASAQVSATANALGTIVAPLSIQKTRDMNFGTVAHHPTQAGRLIMSTSGLRSTTGGPILMSSAGVTPAIFAVLGEPNYAYSITLPVSAVLTNTTSGHSETIIVDNFISSPQVSTGGTIGSNGESTLTVGAQVALNALQASGLYTSGTAFTVTVNYN